MKKEEAQELLRKYRLGQCTKRETEIINHWYDSLSNESKIDLLDADNLNSLGKDIFENIQNKINYPEENLIYIKGKNAVGRKMNILHFQNLRRFAAVLLLGIVVVTFYFYRQNHSIIKEGKTLATEIAPKGVSPSVIYLSDGSVVWLKKDSKLEYPKSFTGNIREVTLTGEAFFDVAEDQKKAFIIHSNNFTTRVLGTTFNIKAYESDESQEVSVVTGKVVVSVNKTSADKVKTVILNSNQKVIYSREDNSLVESNTEELPSYNSFMQSKLAFVETPLGDIIKVLNAHYDVNISVTNKSMDNCIITADLTNETLEISLEILAKTINSKFIIEQNKIILSGNGCPE